MCAVLAIGLVVSCSSGPGRGGDASLPATAPGSSSDATDETGGGRSSSTTSPTDASVAAFCTAWSDYAVTIAAFASTTDDERVRRLEIVAADHLIAAIDGIGAHWPFDLVAERSTVLTDLVGPYSRRARKALVALAAVGATGDDLAELRLVWHDLVAEMAAGASVPDRLRVPAAMDRLVDAAVASFAAAVTGFDADPTLGDRRRLLDPIEAPLTEAYLVANCPSVPGLGVGVEF